MAEVDATESSASDSESSVFPADQVVRASRAGAIELVALARSLGPIGFVRLNNIIRSALKDRIEQAENDIVRHEKFGRPERAESVREFLRLYVTLSRMTDLFIAATSDEAGLDLLGLAFGGAAAGHVHVPAEKLGELFAAWDHYALARTMIGQDEISLRGKIESLRNFASDADFTPLWNLEVKLDETPAAESAEPKTRTQCADLVRSSEDFVDRVVRRISEIPDRNSPSDFPEGMVVTADELREILIDETKNDSSA